MQLEHIISQFKIQGNIQTASPFGSGHINDTYRLYNSEANQPDYLLQRINHQIFSPVGPMMDNIWEVTEHLQHKNESEAILTPSQLIPTIEDGRFYKDSKGDYWRLNIFMKELTSYDMAETPELVYAGAKAFGVFLRQLLDFPVENLFVIIPNFHNVLYRLENLQKAIHADVKNRVGEATEQIQYAWQIADEMSAIQKSGEAGKIPLRVTHNDTKFNNVLLDSRGVGRCVIDLDTIMPGYVHYDFGDGIRTTASTAQEDEADLSKIQINMEYFKAFTAGYLDACHSILTPIELQYLSISGAMLAYLMGVRFLTDFISGDVYYKIHFEKQNLQRAKAQLELCRKLLERKADFDAFISSYIQQKLGF